MLIAKKQSPMKIAQLCGRVSRNRIAAHAPTIVNAAMYWSNVAGVVGMAQQRIRATNAVLDIIEPELITEEIDVPTNLIVVPGSRIKQPAGETVTLHLFTKSQSEKIVVDIKKGYHIGHTTYLNGQIRQQGGGLPTFGEGNGLSSWYNHQSGGLSKKVTLKIFETANPPGHFWQTDKAYRILWEKSFNIDYSEEDIEKLKLKLDSS